MQWSYWAVAGICGIVAEMFTGGFGIIWFGISALCAAAAAYFGMSGQVQTAIFAGVGIALLLLTRPLTRRFHSGPSVQFGTKALIGKQGIVIKPIGDPANPVGQILVNGEEWRAKAAVPIPINAAVKVVDIEGITLVVTPETDAGSAEK